MSETTFAPSRLVAGDPVGILPARAHREDQPAVGTVLATTATEIRVRHPTRGVMVFRRKTGTETGSRANPYRGAQLTLPLVAQRLLDRQAA